jgi:hypothetical protein
MEKSPNKDMIFTFIDAFKLAATTVISALPSDLSDEAAETTSRKLADEINTNAEKLQLTVGVIYTKAMGDENWISTLFVHLSLVLLQHIHDPDVPADKNKTSLVGAMLMRRYIHKTLQGDFQSDMQTPEWSLPRLWLLVNWRTARAPSGWDSVVGLTLREGWWSQSSCCKDPILISCLSMCTGVGLV